MDKIDELLRFDAAPRSTACERYASVAVESDGTARGVKGDFVTAVAQLAGYMDLLWRSGGWRSIRVELLRNGDVRSSSDAPSTPTPS